MKVPRELGDAAKYTILALELLLASIVAAAVVVASIKIASDVVSLARCQGFDKTVFLHILDSTLLVVLAIDVMRTLLTAVVRRELPVRIVIEAALLAVLREFIAVEIRQPSTELLRTLVLIFISLVTFWIIIGILEARGWEVRLPTKRGTREARE